MENGGSDRPKNCVYIRIHSIVMGGRLKPPHWDVKDPDAIRGLARLAAKTAVFIECGLVVVGVGQSGCRAKPAG